MGFCFFFFFGVLVPPEQGFTLGGCPDGGSHLVVLSPPWWSPPHPGGPSGVSHKSCWWHPSFSAALGVLCSPGICTLQDWDARRLSGTLSSALPRAQQAREAQGAALAALPGLVNHSLPGTLGPGRTGPALPGTRHGCASPARLCHHCCAHPRAAQGLQGCSGQGGCSKQGTQGGDGSPCSVITAGFKKPNSLCPPFHPFPPPPPGAGMAKSKE